MHDIAARAEPLTQPEPSTRSSLDAALEIRPGKRRLVLSLLFVSQVTGIAVIAAGHLLPGIGTLVAGHLLLVWATLAPGSPMLGAVATRFVTERREVWLTIDDGPSDDTAATLDLLDAASARATFFLVGARAAQRPDLVRAIVERGHAIGNHSHDHREAWFWAAPPAEMRRQIGTAQHTLTQLSGVAPQVFRAVVGMANVFVHPELERHGLLRIAWSARGYDSVIADPARVWAHMRGDVQPGAILLLHEGAPHGTSVATLRLVLQQLDRLGYRCVLPALTPPGSTQTPAS